MVPGATDGPFGTLGDGGCFDAVSSDGGEELEELEEPEELDGERWRVVACFPGPFCASLLARGLVSVLVFLVIGIGPTFLVEK